MYSCRERGEQQYEEQEEEEGEGWRKGVVIYEKIDKK